MPLISGQEKLTRISSELSRCVAVTVAPSARLGFFFFGLRGSWEVSGVWLIAVGLLFSRRRESILLRARKF